MQLKRLIIIGDAGSGKTTLARELAKILDQPHVEMDTLFWLPDWQQRGRDEFASLVENVTEADRWIVDGNYSYIRDKTSYWSRGTAVIWLNYSLWTAFRRGFWRSLQRSLTGEPMFSGNRESFFRMFLTRESILWWILTSHKERVGKLTALRTSGKYPQLDWIEFKSPRELQTFLKKLRAQMRAG